MERTVGDMAVFTLICYVLACVLFLFAGIARLGNIARIDTSWMVPIGLFFFVLPSLVVVIDQMS